MEVIVVLFLQIVPAAQDFLTYLSYQKEFKATPGVRITSVTIFLAGLVGGPFPCIHKSMTTLWSILAENRMLEGFESHRQGRKRLNH